MILRLASRQRAVVPSTRRRLLCPLPSVDVDCRRRQRAENTNDAVVAACALRSISMASHDNEEPLHLARSLSTAHQAVAADQPQHQSQHQSQQQQHQSQGHSTYDAGGGQGQHQVGHAEALGGGGYNGDFRSWQASHNVDIQRVTQTAMVHELTQQQTRSIERVVPWFLNTMPAPYFRQVSVVKNVVK